MARPDCLYCLGPLFETVISPSRNPLRIGRKHRFPWAPPSMACRLSARGHQLISRWLGPHGAAAPRRHFLFFRAALRRPVQLLAELLLFPVAHFSAKLRLYLLGHPPHGRFGRFRFRGSFGDLNFLSILLGCWIYVSRGSGGLPPHQPQYGSSGLCCLSAGCPLGRRHLRGSRPGSHRGRGSSSAASSCIRSPWQPA